MKKNRRYILSLCCAVLCAALTQPAQAATGSIIDAKTGSAVAGAEVTCQLKYKGNWVDWTGVIDPVSGDPATSASNTYGAEYYGQNNPVHSDTNGRYGWMMPAGTYRVVVTAEGYEKYTSSEFIVGGASDALSPSEQVNISLLQKGSGGGSTPGGGDSSGSGSGGGGSSSGGGSSDSSDDSSRPDTAALIKASLSSGRVEKGSLLTLTASSRFTIRYTMDGTAPTLKSALYSGPILIDRDMTVKVAAVKNGQIGNVVTYTYTVFEAQANARYGVFRPDAGAIRYLAAYEDGTFRPNQAVTRYEVVEALAHLVVLEESDGPLSFSDVDSSHAQTVSRMVRSGLINGINANSFRGEDPMTRGQLCKLLVLALELTPGTGETEFSDIPSRHWALPYIETLTKAGYINGYTDGTFRPDRPVSRAELAALLNRAVGRKGIEAKPAELPDVPTRFWGYQDIMDSILLEK